MPQKHTDPVFITMVAALVLAAAAMTWLIVVCRCNWAWDDANYLYHGIYHANQVSEQGNFYWLRLPYSLLFESTKPPLLTGLTAAVLLVFDKAENLAAVALVIGAAFLALTGAVWIISSVLFGRRAAAFAVLILLASPMTLWLGSDLMVETLLSLWILLTLYMGAGMLEQPTYLKSAALGLVVGLGMLSKLTFAGFVGFPALWLLVLYIRRFGAGWHSFARLGVLLATAALVALPWYLRNWESALHHVHSASTFYEFIGQEPLSTLERISRVSLDLAGIPLLVFFAVLILIPGSVQLKLLLSRGQRSTVFLQCTFASILPILGMMLMSPYFNSRFMQPAWPLLAVAAGCYSALVWTRMATVIRYCIIGLLVTAIGYSLMTLVTQREEQIPWSLAAALDQISESGAEGIICNVGSTAQWNIYKLRAINETREGRRDITLRDLEPGMSVEECDGVIIGTDYADSIGRSRSDLEQFTGLAQELSRNTAGIWDQPERQGTGTRIPATIYFKISQPDIGNSGGTGN